MSESKLWNRVKNQNKSVFFQRIESDTAIGIPDLYLIYKGVAGWAELKWIPRWPKSDDIVIKIYHYTMAQRRWLKKNHDNGGNSFLILGIGNKEILCFKGEDALKVGAYTKKQLQDKSIPLIEMLKELQK